MTKEMMKDDLRVFVVPVEILDFPDIDIYEQMAYMVLRSFTNARDNSAFPSYETIAKLGRMSRRKAIYAVGSLIEKGLVTKETRLTTSKHGRIRNTSNLYTVKRPAHVMHDMHPQSAECAPTPVHDMHSDSAQPAPESFNLLKKSLRKSLEEKNKEVSTTSQSVSLFKVPSIAIKIFERQGLTDRLEDIETVYASVHNEKGFSDGIFIQVIQKEAVHREAANPEKSSRAFRNYLLKAVMNNIVEHEQFASQLLNRPDQDEIKVDPDNDDPVMAVALPVVQKMKRGGYPVSLIHQFAVEAIQDTFNIPTWTEAKLMFKALNILDV
jgi:Helix-turn-helix domain